MDGATTSVPDSDKAFFLKLKTGVLEAIRGLEKEYDKDTEPPVIHKSNIGGEVGCFGVHEDCLVAFNTRMVGSITIWDQKKNKEDSPEVKP